MTAPKPLTLEDFTPEQVVEALKLVPEQIQASVVGVATMLELQDRRSKD